MKNNRKTKGFTLAETLVTVAIISIVMAFGFIAVSKYRKTMKYMEMQAAAKEIYLAAQEHLALASMENLLDDLDPDGNAFGTKYNGNQYIVTSADASDASSVLNIMLPSGSIEEYAKGKNYAILYNKNSYKVIDVYYSDKVDFSSYLRPGTNTGEAEEIGDPFAMTVYATEVREDTSSGTTGAYSIDRWDALTVAAGAGATEAQRQDFNPLDNSGTTQVVGYFGVLNYEVEVATETGAPMLEVINENLLYAKIYAPATYDYVANSQRLVITQRDDEAREISIPWSDVYRTEMVAGESFHVYYVILDSVEGDGNFKSLASKEQYMTDTGKPILLGSNLKIKAVAQIKSKVSVTEGSEKSSTETSKEVESNIEYANSLFDENTKIEVDSETKTTSITAHISNFRHLQNLGTNVSGFGNAATGTDTIKFDSYTAYMDKSLDWDDYASALGADYEEATGSTKAYTPTYKSISPSYALKFDGKRNKISNLEIKSQGASPAGVFGTINTSGEIKALNIYNAQVSGGSKDAGSLIGKIDISSGELSIIGTVARNTTAKGDSQTADGVVTTGNAGGLIGSINNTGGKVAVTQSAASVYVNGGTSAGGLIGSTSGAVTISESYAGGHTKAGEYQESSEGQGRYNVIATSDAGGLIGNSSSQTTASYTYATTSVYGANAGKYIGAGGINVSENSYAAGIARSVNGTVYETSGLADEDVLAAELVTDESNDKRTTAEPYDTTLIDGEAKKLFAYPTILQLHNGSDGTGAAYNYLFLNVHIGDWVTEHVELPDDTKIWTVTLIDADNTDDHTNYSHLKAGADYEGFAFFKDPAVLSTQYVMDGGSVILPNNSNIEGWRWWVKKDGTWQEMYADLVYRYEAGKGWGVYDLKVEDKARVYSTTVANYRNNYPGYVKSDIIVSPIYNNQWTLTVKYIDKDNNTILDANSQEVEQVYTIVSENQTSITDIVDKSFGGYMFDGYYIKKGESDYEKIAAADAGSINLVDVEKGYDLSSQSEYNATIYARYNVIETYVVTVQTWLNQEVSTINAYNITKDTSDVPVSIKPTGAEYEFESFDVYIGDTLKHKYTESAQGTDGQWANISAEENAKYVVPANERVDTRIDIHFKSSETVQYTVNHIFKNSALTDTATSVIDTSKRGLKADVFKYDANDYTETETNVNAISTILKEKLALSTYDGYHVTSAEPISDGSTTINVTYERNGLAIYFADQNEEGSTKKYATWSGDSRETSSTHAPVYNVVKYGMLFAEAKAAIEASDYMPNNKTTDKPQLVSEEADFTEWKLYEYNTSTGEKTLLADTDDAKILTGALFAEPVWVEKKLPIIKVELWKMKVDADTDADLYGSNDVPTDYALKQVAYDFDSYFTIDTSKVNGAFGDTLTGESMTYDLALKLADYAVTNSSSSALDNYNNIYSDGSEEVNSCKIPLFYHFPFNSSLTSTYNGDVGSIKPDGTTTVRLYYTRQKININFHTGTLIGDTTYYRLNNNNNKQKLYYKASNGDYYDLKASMATLTTLDGITYVNDSSTILKVPKNNISIDIYTDKQGNKYTGAYVYIDIGEHTDLSNLKYFTSYGIYIKGGELATTENNAASPWSGLYQEDFANYADKKYSWSGTGYAWIMPSGNSNSLQTYFDDSSLDGNNNDTIDVYSMEANKYTYTQKTENSSARAPYNVNVSSFSPSDFNQVDMPTTGTTLTLRDKYNGYEVVGYGLGNGNITSAKDGSKLSVSDDNLRVYQKRKAYTIYLNDYNLTDAQITAIKSNYPNINADSGADTIQCLYKGDVNAVLQLLNTDMKAAARPSSVDSDYKFDGWYEDAGKTVQITTGSMKMPANNIQVFAKWSAPGVKVTPCNVDNKGNSEKGTPITKTKGQLVTDSELTNLEGTNDDYHFVGWYTDEKHLQKFVPAATPIDKDMNIYACWVQEGYITVQIECIDAETGHVFYTENRELQKTNDYSANIASPTEPDWEKGENQNEYTQDDVIKLLGRTTDSNAKIKQYDTDAYMVTVQFIYSLGSISVIDYSVEEYLQVGDSYVSMDTLSVSQQLSYDVYRPRNIAGLKLVQGKNDKLETAIPVTEQNQVVKVYYALDSDYLSATSQTSGYYNGSEYQTTITGLPETISTMVTDETARIVYSYRKSGTSDEYVVGQPKDAGSWQVMADIQVQVDDEWESIWSGTATQNIFPRRIVLSDEDIQVVSGGYIETNSVIGIKDILDADDTDSKLELVVAMAGSVFDGKSGIKVLRIPPANLTDDDGSGLLESESMTVSSSSKLEYTKDELKALFKEGETTASIKVRVECKVSSDTKASNYDIVVKEVTITLDRNLTGDHHSS